MATAQIGVVRAALLSDIDAQLTSDAVTGVATFAFPPGDEAPATDLVFIGDISSPQEHLTFGGSRTETLSIPVHVYVLTAGKGDTVATTTEDRALEIAASLETAIRTDDTISATAFHAQITSVDTEAGVSPEGRYSQVTVTIDCEVHI